MRKAIACNPATRPRPLPVAGRVSTVSCETERIRPLTITSSIVWFTRLPSWLSLGSLLSSALPSLTLRRGRRICKATQRHCSSLAHLKRLANSETLGSNVRMELYCEIVACDGAKDLVDDSNVCSFVIIHRRVKLGDKISVGAL